MTIKEKLKGRNLTNLVNNKINTTFSGKTPNYGKKEAKEVLRDVLDLKYVLAAIIGLCSLYYLV